MTTTNQTRRNVMLTAWSFRRAEPSRPFADCLRGAWRFTKEMAAEVGRFLARAKKGGGQVRLSRSLVRSPIGRRYGHGSLRDFTAAYTTALVGR